MTQRGKPRPDMTERRTYQCGDRFADEGQPPGTPIKIGVSGMQQGPDLSAALSVQSLGTDPSSRLPSIELHLTSQAWSSSGQRGRDSQPCLVFLRSFSEKPRGLNTLKASAAKDKWVFHSSKTLLAGIYCARKSQDGN